MEKIKKGIDSEVNKIVSCRKKWKKMFLVLHTVDMHVCYAKQKINLACPNLWHQPAFAQMTKYLMPHLCSAHLSLRLIWMKQAMSEVGLLLFLKNGKTIRKTSIMESKNFFTKSLDDCHWLFHKWEHGKMKHFRNCSDNDN